MCYCLLHLILSGNESAQTIKLAAKKVPLYMLHREVINPYIQGLSYFQVLRPGVINTYIQGF